MTWRPALWLVAAGVVIVDQVSKQWVLNNLEPYVLHPVLGKWLGIELVFNSGAAFSFGNSTTWLLTIVAIAVTVAIVYYARRAQTPAAVWVFGIGLGGAIGNLIDRLFRAPSFGQGHVVDFINYNNWFVGNVADIAIVAAAIVVVLMGLTGRQLLSNADGDSADSVNSQVSDAPGAGDDSSPKAHPSE
ncbi:signal peptidase II [Demequina aurantiaca]|uniref:signal peptidase II n=1 Tax=Demequina aurantiaca TaxID=676200 RepID=UPI003D33278F